MTRGEAPPSQALPGTELRREAPPLLAPATVEALAALNERQSLSAVPSQAEPGTEGLRPLFIKITASPRDEYTNGMAILRLFLGGAAGDVHRRADRCCRFGNASRWAIRPGCGRRRTILGNSRPTRCCSWPGRWRSVCLSAPFWPCCSFAPIFPDGGSGSAGRCWCSSSPCRCSCRPGTRCSAATAGCPGWRDGLGRSGWRRTGSDTGPGAGHLGAQPGRDSRGWY